MMGTNVIQDLFQGQMDYIFFFRGLAFFLVLAICCLFRGDLNQRLPWRWFGLFALAQGVASWLLLVALNLPGPFYIQTLSGGLYLISWFFLTEFGRSGMNRTRGQDSGLWLVALLLMITALGGLKGWSGIAAVSRYTLGLIGGFWAAAVLFIAGRHLPSQNRGSSLTASISLGLFSLSTALSPPPPLLISGSFFNQDLFLRLTGVPPELFQGLMAFGIAAGIYGYLPWREKSEEAQDTRYRSRYMFAILATLSIILALGSVSTLYLGEWANTRHEKIKGEVHAYATIVVNRLNAEFKRLEYAATALAETSWLAPSLRRGNEDQERINSLLDSYRDGVNASVCYLMDITGMTIASSNRSKPDSFVGHSYAFRPYFNQAISGFIGRYFAVGATSKVPGYYVSCPVRDPRGNITRGVAVIKVSMDKIADELKTAVEKGDSLMCLADSHGIVFLASNADMIFKSLWPVEERDRAELQAQYGKGQFPAIFPQKFGDGAKVEHNGRNYLASYAGTIIAGWSVFFFRPIEPLGMYRLAGILVACILVIMALVSLGSNLYLKEYTLPSAELFRAIFDSAPEAVAVIDPDTSQVIKANLFMAKTLGYARKDLLALKLDGLSDQDPKNIRDQLLKMIQENEVVRQKWQFRHKDGTRKELEIIGAKINHQGKPQALILGRELATSPQIGTSRTPDAEHFFQANGASEAQSGGGMDEFSNILSLLILQTELILGDLPAESSAGRNLLQMLQSVVRTKDGIRNMAVREANELRGHKSASLQGKRILLVDDKEQLCRLEEKLLKRLGYQVTAFTDGTVALEVFRKNPGEFDLVITDSSMPKLSGLDLAKELLQLRPGLPIILVYGLSEMDNISRGQQMGLKEFLQKPILTADLGKAIQRVLEEHYID